MKKTLVICIIILAVLFCMPLTGCEEEVEFDPKSMTMEEHADLIYERVKDFYIGGKYPYINFYTDYEAFPIYDENDELTHFVVEFEPYGFVYVNINYKAESDSYLYIRDERERHAYPWQRYTVDEDSEEPEPIYEEDENGFVYRYNSHYKEAGIKGERRYLINIKSQNNDIIYDTIYKIPAVKRGDKWLNLISMEEFALSDDLQKQAHFEMRFQWSYLK